jgi:hypothetical protein
MRFETRSFTTFYFTQEEVDYLDEIGVWELLCARFNANERVEIE